MIYMLFQDFFQFIHKGIHIFKLPIHRSETDIGNRFQIFEFIHHDFSDHRAWDLPFFQIKHLCFHIIYQPVDLFC